MLEYQRATQRVTGTVRSFSGGSARKIEPVEVETIRANYDAAAIDSAIKSLQTTIYALCGGGMLADFACRQPAEFYIDQRCAVKNKRQIYNAVALLCVFGAAGGYNLTGFEKDGGKPLPRPSLPYAGWILDP